MRRNVGMVSGREGNGREKGVRFGEIESEVWSVVGGRVGTDVSVMGVGKIWGWGDCSWAWSPPDMGGRDIAGPSNEYQDHT